jgi:subtilisin family serine protease
MKTQKHSPLDDPHCFAGRSIYLVQVIVLLSLAFGVGLTLFFVSIPSATAASSPVSSIAVTDHVSANQESVQFIVMLKTPPIAVRQTQLEQNRALSLKQLDSDVKVHAARILVEQTATLDRLQKNGLIQKVDRQFTYLINGLVVTGRLENQEAIARLPEVEAIYLNHKVYATLDSSVPLIGAPALWSAIDSSGNQVTGQGIKVAIIDTGIDYTHPDLGGCLGTGCKVAGGYDFVNNDNDAMDDHGHGTHVAGIVAANGAIRGVAPGATLFSYKVLDGSGTGTWDNVIAAISQAIRDEQVDVINLSLGGIGGGPDDPVAQAVNNAVDAGVTVVVAAGNEGQYRTITSPGVAAKAVTVGASSKNEQLTLFTSRGPVAAHLMKPDLVAPGENISSTWLNRGYQTLNGTSMASPHVAGAVALLTQMHPNWTPAMIKANLMNSARYLGNDPYAEGAGRLQIDQAARTRLLIQPGSLSMGRIDSSQPVWTSAQPVYITNLSADIRRYQLNIVPGHPFDGISITVSHGDITLAPGQTQTVLLNLSVDRTSIVYPGAQPYAYYGRIIVANESEQQHLPFAFIPPSLDCQTQNQIPLSECKALETLYYSTNGTHWYINSGWLDLPPCGWHGITCRDGHVREVYLTGSGWSGNNLTGEIPPQLEDLEMLNHLNLRFNNLTGEIPRKLGNLRYLRILGLTGNQLSGNIPPELGNFPNLEVLQLGNNQLQGNIPDELGNLLNVQEIELLGNRLSGSIPASLGNLARLRELNLRQNELSGNIPRELGNLSNLTGLGLGVNQLSGAIPPELGRLRNLDSLFLSYNQLSGEIPVELGNLTQLGILS